MEINYVGQIQTESTRIRFECDALDGGVRQEVKVLRWRQANQLTDSMEAGEPSNWPVNRRLGG